MGTSSVLKAGLYPGLGHKRQEQFCIFVPGTSAVLGKCRSSCSLGWPSATLEIPQAVGIW